MGGIISGATVAAMSNELLAVVLFVAGGSGLGFSASLHCGTRTALVGGKTLHTKGVASAYW